jgi:DNA modification methylase
MDQLTLPISVQTPTRKYSNYRKKYLEILQGDFNFQNHNSTYSAHAFHAFPAKFPPQLPGVFIEGMSKPGEIILDPMMGSGTTLLEARLLGRKPIGFDIDPLSTLISYSKVTSIDPIKAAEYGEQVAERADSLYLQSKEYLGQVLKQRFDPKTLEFINYWFDPQTQLELVALISGIDGVQDPAIRSFLTIVFSSIIITKSGGVSLARDLAHTRPHKDLTKVPKPAIKEFRKRLKTNLKGILSSKKSNFLVGEGNAQYLPISNNSIDLIVTSPPYASNAIDYIRASKFSLVWLRHTISELGDLRISYIGGENITGFSYFGMPVFTETLLNKLGEIDIKKSKVIHRYFSEMKGVLQEMFRVLRPGKAAVVVVGTSLIRGLDIETQNCLAEKGEMVGLEVVKIAERQIDRDKRMMPARKNGQNQSQIEERMHKEYVIGFLKPEG